MKTDVSKLLSKQMDRRDFLKHVGVGFVALTGMATIVKTMNDVSSPRRSSGGYGSSSYGGIRPVVRR